MVTKRAKPKPTRKPQKPAARSVAKPVAKKRSVAKPVAKKPAAKKPVAKTTKKPVAKATRKRAPKVTPAPPIDAAINEAMHLLNAGELAQAADAFLAAARLAPEDWRLPNEAGICFYRLERYDDALRCYNQALAASPENVDVLLNKGLAYVLSDRDDDALASFGAVFAFDPTHPGAHFEVGKILQKRGQFEDAYAQFDTALAHETMQTMFNVLGGRPRNAHLIALVMLNKARLLLGPLAREADGLAQVKSLWDTLGDDASILRLARELAIDRPELAKRVLGVLIAADPTHSEARELAERL